MSDFKKRLEEEHSLLLDKIDKLEDFTNNIEFKEIPVSQQNLLQIQLPIMYSYANCLASRIEDLEFYILNEEEIIKITDKYLKEK